MSPVFCLAEPELRPSPDDSSAVVKKNKDHIFEGKFFCLSVYDRQVDNSEGALELRSCIQLAQDEVGVGIALKFNDYPHSLSVRLVPEVRYAVYHSALYAFGYRLDKICLVDHVGNF